MESVALSDVLARPDIWRGDCRADAILPTVASGFAMLDAELPGGGWPRGALTELLCDGSGVGEISLLQPALRRACLNTGFDMLSLYFIFLAAGNTIDPIVLITGYSVSFLLRIAAFFIPGGVGVVESGMVAIYFSMGIPTSLSVVVILVYRLFSFWLPSIIGFAVIEYLKRTAD